MNHALAAVLGALLLGAAPLTGAAEKADDLPLSKDALFADDPPEARAQPERMAKDDLPASRDALFADEPEQGKMPLAASEQGKVVPAGAGETGGWTGFLQTELAYAYDDPTHWTKVLGRLEIGTQGRLGQGVRWKASGRVSYNPVYDLTDHYNAKVRSDQRAEFQIRETYLDFSSGDWDWRLGRQHVIWGEMVGLFFADVVSAKDLREFILPDFHILRIPQWAARAEYFKDDFHAELVWIPFPSYDEIGRPFSISRPGAGADFYPYPASPPGVPFFVEGEKKPGYGLGNGNYGLRVSRLTGGWDLSGFYYRSLDSQATFYRAELPGPAYVYRPRHERIWQAGGTLAKDLGSVVLKAEAVYTDGRRYNVTNTADADGVVKQNTLDWVVGLDFNPGDDTRVNTQFFQRVYFDHAPDIIPDRVENGVSLLVNHKLPRNWEAEVMVIRSLNRDDWLFRPKLAWGFERNWRLTLGADIFGGPDTGLFGRYDHQDRVYGELRHDF